MAKKKAAHGGARPGAGRPPNPEGRTVAITATVPESLAEALEAVAQTEGWSRSKAVTEAIRAFVARKKR
jgi:hypothetical protein